MPRKAATPTPANHTPVTRFKPQTQVVTSAQPVKLPEELWDKVEALGHFIQIGTGSKPADRNFIIEQALTMALAGEKQFDAFYQNQWPELRAKGQSEQQSPEPIVLAASAGR